MRQHSRFIANSYTPFVCPLQIMMLVLLNMFEDGIYYTLTYLLLRIRTTSCTYTYRLSQNRCELQPGVNILPKEQIFSPMLPSCDHKVSPFLPHFCDYMRGSVATKPLTAWGPGARLRAPGGVQGQSPWWGSRGQCPRKLQGFSQFNILRNSLQRALS